MLFGKYSQQANINACTLYIDILMSIFLVTHIIIIHASLSENSSARLHLQRITNHKKIILAINFFWYVHFFSFL